MERQAIALAGSPLEGCLRQPSNARPLLWLRDQPPAPSLEAEDDCDPSPSVGFAEVRTAEVCPGQFNITRTWTATDRCGNERVERQLMTVLDTTAPVFSDVPPEVTVECDAVPPPASVTVMDSCDPAPVIEMTETRIDGTCVGTYC